MQVTDILWPTNLDFSPRDDPAMKLMEPLGMKSNHQFIINSPQIHFTFYNYLHFTTIYSFYMSDIFCILGQFPHSVQRPFPLQDPQAAAPKQAQS